MALMEYAIVNIILGDGSADKPAPKPDPKPPNVSTVAFKVIYMEIIYILKHILILNLNYLNNYITLIQMEASEPR